MIPEKLLRIDLLSKRFQGKVVLDKIFGTLTSSCTTVILGASGAGKSLFLRCLIGLENPDEGRLFWKEEEISGKKGKIFRKKMGIVFQHFHLFPHKTILANLLYAPLYHNKSEQSELSIQAKKWLDKLGLSDKEESYPDQLSGGQKQRIAVIRALLLFPELLLFDEPTSALDPESTRNMEQLMKALPEKMGKVVVTHDISFAKRIADIVWFFEKGKLIECEDSTKFFESPKTLSAQKFLYHT